MDAAIKALPDEYRKFVKNDFRSELKKYRIDYILAVEPLSRKVLTDLGNPTPVFESNASIIYSLP